MTSPMSTEWYVEGGATLPDHKFTRNHMMPANKINTFRFKYNNVGVFSTAYMYDSEIQSEANLLGDFYLDLDYNLEGDHKEEAFNVVRQDVLNSCRYIKVILGIDPDNIYIYFSGSKGIHIIIPKEALGVVPDKNLNKYYRMLAEDISKFTTGKTIDLKIYDNRRLFRLPNSIHPKTDLYKVYLSYEEIKSLTFESILSIAKEPRIIPSKAKIRSPKASMEIQNYTKKFEMLLSRTRTNLPSTATLEHVPPCVEYLLKNKIGSGQRNATVAFLASFFKQSGLSEKETVEKINNWNEANCSPTLPDKEINITVGSIYQGPSKMGCTAAKMLSYCDEGKCKIKNKRGGFSNGNKY